MEILSSKIATICLPDGWELYHSFIALLNVSFHFLSFRRFVLYKSVCVYRSLSRGLKASTKRHRSPLSNSGGIKTKSNLSFIPRDSFTGSTMEKILPTAFV